MRSFLARMGGFVWLVVAYYRWILEWEAFGMGVPLLFLFGSLPKAFSFPTIPRSTFDSPIKDQLSPIGY